MAPLLLTLAPVGEGPPTPAECVMQFPFLCVVPDIKLLMGCVAWYRHRGGHWRVGLFSGCWGAAERHHSSRTAVAHAKHMCRRQQVHSGACVSRGHPDASPHVHALIWQNSLPCPAEIGLLVDTPCCGAGAQPALHHTGSVSGIPPRRINRVPFPRRPAVRPHLLASAPAPSMHVQHSNAKGDKTGTSESTCAV